MELTERPTCPRCPHEDRNDPCTAVVPRERRSRRMAPNKAMCFACQRSLNTVAWRRFFASRALDDGRCQGLPLLIVHQGGPSPKSPRGSSGFEIVGRRRRCPDAMEVRLVVSIASLRWDAEAHRSACGPQARFTSFPLNSVAFAAGLGPRFVSQLLPSPETCRSGVA
jgi:hypothetical protein